MALVPSARRHRTNTSKADASGTLDAHLPTSDTSPHEDIPQLHDARSWARYTAPSRAIRSRFHRTADTPSFDRARQLSSAVGSVAESPTHARSEGIARIPAKWCGASFSLPVLTLRTDTFHRNVSRAQNDCLTWLTPSREAVAARVGDLKNTAELTGADAERVRACVPKDSPVFAQIRRVTCRSCSPERDDVAHRFARQH